MLFRCDAAFRAAAAIVDLACCTVADTAASRLCALRASCGVGVRFWTSRRCLGAVAASGTGPRWRIASRRRTTCPCDCRCRCPCRPARQQRATWRTAPTKSGSEADAVACAQGQPSRMWRPSRRCRHCARRTHAFARGAPTHSAVALSEPAAYATVQPHSGSAWVSTGSSGCWGRC